MENKFVKFSPNADWSDYTFIMACVSVGNIGQLSTDLLISTFSNTNKAGYLISNMVQPIIGSDPYVQKSTNISLSCELYENTNLKIVLFQQRAPLFKGKRTEFINLMADFIQRERFRETICLTSSHAYERLDSQLVGLQCRYLSVNKNEHLEQKLNWKLLEKRLDHNHNCSEANTNELIDFIPGGGVAEKFFKISKEKNLNTTVLIVFAHEGNNIPEAVQLVTYLNEWKNYLLKNNVFSSPTSKANCMSPWRVPISWKYLFGNSIDPNTRFSIF